ncbi:hypothetical protein VTO73DRAFT_3086 [Trametes versicolor]
MSFRSLRSPLPQQDIHNLEHRHRTTPTNGSTPRAAARRRSSPCPRGAYILPRFHDTRRGTMRPRYFRVERYAAARGWLAG